MDATGGTLVGMGLAGVATGVVGAILGTGGGVFLIPLLVLVLGVPMHHAVATSILTVIATSCAAASTNVERGTANMKLGMTLEVFTTLGALAGGLTAGFLHAATLELIFAMVLLPTAWMMWRGRGEAGTGTPLPPETDPGLLGGRFTDEATGESIVYRVHRLWAGLLVSFVAGNLSGLLGIGGGVFKVPAIHLLCRVPMKVAAATSNFMIGVTAAASAVLYFGRGEVRPILTAAVVLGVLGGSTVGSVLNRRIRGRTVRLIFAGLLALVAVQMLARAVLMGR